MIRINLLPVPKARQQEALIIQAVAAVLAIGLTFGGCYLVTGTKQKEVDKVQEQISQTERKINELKAKVGEVEKYKKKLKTLEDQLGVIRKLQSGRSGPVRMMDEFTDLVPRKLWISSFKESAGKVALIGEADSGPVIADFLENLKKAKYFSNPQLGKVTASGQGTESTHKFDINVNVKYTF